VFSLFFDSGARKGSALRTLPQHPPIVIHAVSLLELITTLSLSLSSWRVGEYNFR